LFAFIGVILTDSNKITRPHPEVRVKEKYPLKQVLQIRLKLVTN